MREVRFSLSYPLLFLLHVYPKESSLVLGWVTDRGSPNSNKLLESQFPRTHVKRRTMGPVVLFILVHRRVFRLRFPYSFRVSPGGGDDWVLSHLSLVYTVVCYLLPCDRNPSHLTGHLGYSRLPCCEWRLLRLRMAPVPFGQRGDDSDSSAVQSGTFLTQGRLHFHHPLLRLISNTKDT